MDNWKQKALLAGYFNNLEKHSNNSTRDSETGSDPECILKVESKRFPERLAIGMEKKKRIMNNFTCIEQLCEK